MKYLATFIILFSTFCSFSQEAEEAQLLALKKANNYVYEGNSLINESDYVSAEMEYRKAISENPTNIAGIYNLGNSYYTSGSMDEALFRLEEAAKTATSKSEKHKAFHNIGTILMKGKKCKEAVEAYKSALRNDPTDDETRYNLGIAKACAEQQKDQNKDDENKDDKEDKNEDDKKDQDNKDENKDNKDGDDKEDNKDKKDEGDQDKKEGDDKKDEDGKPKDEKEDKNKEDGKGDQDKKEQPQPQPGQMSPQQMKNLLEAMNNQEQKVQEKMNAEKVKGVKVQTDKDW
ncbi:tetratricopeptide repeat protein [Algibacter miyuki]|uniref:Tetratricopeptide repeat protein n=1 Tax=Algibacter miyuki TaxID=1306933 RepID=A0ABV5GVR2_9FLAO|nr:tetratricopeptide repeat protein [Algibacter miyuki]MDN3665060.1 tetratricopeptide repeat protein [Algibacter miyuki]